jgi:hypothetical protein
MAVSGTYYLNGPDLATSTAIFADEDMNICASNGLYSNGIIVRELLNCVLLPAQPCPQCALPCGQVGGESADVRGTFLGQISGGTDVGAVVIYSIVGNTIPDGILTTYNGQTYNQLTYIGNNQGPVGLNTPLGQPTYYGSPNNTPVSTSALPIYTIQADGTYIPTGNIQPITVNASQIDLRGGGTRVYTQVIPKNSASVSQINVDFYGPIQGTFFSFQTDCPIQLDSFAGSPVQGDDTCADATVTYYFAQNANVTSIQPTVFVPETLTTPGIGNYVFLDGGAGTKINDTATSQFVILADSTYIEIQYGIVISTGSCTPPVSPGNPCNTNFSASNPSNGYFTADIDVGGTPSDVGAIVIHMYMGAVIPDGVLATYNGNTYNIITSQNNTNQFPFGREFNSGTGLPTYVGFPDTFGGSPYTNVTDYSLQNGTYQSLGTTRTISVAGSQNSTDGEDVFTLVIPKPSATPSTFQLEFFAPINNTFFIYTVSCPAALQSFSSTGPNGGIFCANPTETYYFAPNATYDPNTQAFTTDTNTIPKVGNFVYEDSNGVTPLNDNTTPEYYIINNSSYIQVRYGMVIATGGCDPT